MSIDTDTPQIIALPAVHLRVSMLLFCSLCFAVDPRQKLQTRSRGLNSSEGWTRHGSHSLDCVWGLSKSETRVVSFPNHSRVREKSWCQMCPAWNELTGFGSGSWETMRRELLGRKRSSPQSQDRCRLGAPRGFQDLPPAAAATVEESHRHISARLLLGSKEMAVGQNQWDPMLG